MYLDNGVVRHRKMHNANDEPGSFSLMADDVSFVYQRNGDALCLWHSHPTSHRIDPSIRDQLGHPLHVPYMGIVTLTNGRSGAAVINFWRETGSGSSDQ
jgi:proteasome lid subunit RPN8/RPN11